MNRNTNAHFSQLPAVDIKRSTFDRSFSHKFSGLVGRVIPIFYDEVLPGDTIVMDTSKVIRFQTMLTPLMDSIYCDVYFHFVPYRQIWDHWVNLMGENTASAWAPSAEYHIPKIVVPPKAGEGDAANNNKVGTILDYLGFPVEMSSQASNIKVNALPIRAYCKVIEDWFRDENLQDPINLYTGDSDVTATTEASYINDLPHGGVPFVAAKFADYFTSALPSPQKGNSVNLPLIQGDKAPVGTRSGSITSAISSSFNNVPLCFWTTNENTHPFADGTNYTFALQGHSPVVADGIPSYGLGYATPNEPGSVDKANLVPKNLWADLSSTVGAVSINELRFAFQMQRLLERDARGGSRYIETIKAHFNVDSPDQRLQRSEYLGGNRFPIIVNQVSNTAQSSGEYLGDLGAFSVTSDRHSDFTKSFTEHGCVIGTMVIRYDHTYCQGLEKFWLRDDRYDFYWPVFANIGEQPIDKREIYLTGTGTFGYQEAWADYRYKPNRVSGQMRPYVNQGLAGWTLADDYASAPSLSDNWIRESETNVDRTLAVTSSAADQFWADIYFNFRHTRPMPVYSIPGLIDHN